MQDLIYFDNNATTRVHPEAIEAMRPFLDEAYANPSSVHRFGQAARYAVECARDQVAGLLGASTKEIIFTSSGTEAINLAIRGILATHPERRHVVTTAVEHSCVLHIMEHLQTEGYAVDFVGVDQHGCIDEAEWSAKITERTALASLIHVNNETGVIFDIAKLAESANGRGVPVHVDAAQSAGKLAIDVSSLPVALLSMSAHKFHGPKGVAALYVRRRTRLTPLVIGGGQERNLRGGTENVPGIVGMGVAAEASKTRMAETAKGVESLRNAFERGVLKAIPFASINGQGAPRIHNTSNISFEGLLAEAILLLLSEAGICASTGAACSSGSFEPSHVLQAMGIDDRKTHGAVRFSLSHLNTQAEVDRVLSVLPNSLAKLTKLYQ